MFEELRFFFKIIFLYYFVNNFGNKYDYVFLMLRIVYYWCKGFNFVVYVLLFLWDRKLCVFYIFCIFMII